MRRLIAYVSMASAMLIGVGAAFAPTFTKMKEGREFSSSREIVLELTNKDESLTPMDSKKVEAVADVMKDRLDSLGIEDYSVKIGTENEDESLRYSANISVSFATNDDTLFDYASRLLEFSKSSLSLRSTNEEAAAENVFENVEAYIWRDSGTIPYVILPVSNKEEVKSFLKVVSGEEDEGGDSGETKSALPYIRHNADTAEGDGENADSNPDVYVVANWEEGDSINNTSKNPYTEEKIIMAFRHDNIWNPNSSEEETEFRFLCGSANDQGEYDLTALKKANQQANFLVSMLNATEYTYSVNNLFKDVSNTDGIKYNYLTNNASTEVLVSFSNNDLRLTKSTTLTATIIAVVIISLLLVLFFRLSALGAIANTLGTLILTYILFFAMTPTFNIAAIVGGIVITALSLLSEVVYMHKLREEIYKGRSLKKANTEAMRRTNFVNLDVSVIVAFAGLMFYILGGEALKSFGVIAFFGAIINVLMYQLIYRLLNWLVTNSTYLSTKLGVFNVETDKVPNVALDEKETYVSPYENKDFTKRKKPIGIIAGVLLAASIAGIAVFGAIKGSPLNIGKATKDTTTITTTLDENVSKLDSTAFKEEVLKNVYLNGKQLDVSNAEVVRKEQVRYDIDEGLNQTTYFYVATLPTTLTNSKVTYKVGNETIDADSIQEAVTELVYKAAVKTAGVDVSVKSVSETVATPKQDSIAIAAAVTIAGACLYIALRYRVSRAISLLCVSAGASAATYGLLALTRIATSGASAILLPVVAITTLLFGIIYLDREKELVKEEKVKPNLETRNAIMIKSLSRAALPLFSFLVLVAYLAVNYFGFGPANFAVLFGSSLVGILIGLVGVLVLAGPFGSILEKLFSKIKWPKIRRKDKGPVQSKPKTSEPQETIFIGIND